MARTPEAMARYAKAKRDQRATIKAIDPEGWAELRAKEQARVNRLNAEDPERRIIQAAKVRAYRAANPDKLKAREKADPKRKARRQAAYRADPTGHNLKRVAYAKANPEKHNATRDRSRIKEKFKTFPGFRLRSGSVCECCGDDIALTSAKGRLAADHCHNHGHFRGWICRHCNAALGYARDDTARLQSMIRYLDRDRAAQQGRAA